MRKKSTSGTNENGMSNSKQTVYQRGSSQRDSSPHYVFLYSDDDDDDDDVKNDEETIVLQLKATKSTTPRKIEVINVSLKPEDTLQALALRYRCTISELKRINNIHKENEIFARRSIKVPVQPFSLLTEMNTDLLGLNNVTNLPESSGKNEDVHLSRDERIMNMISNPVVSFSSATNDINSVILNSVCEPSSGSLQNDEVDLVNDEEIEQLLSASERDTTGDADGESLFNCSGADWGLSWRQLIGVSLLLSFAGPVIYILYLAENAQQHVKTEQTV